MELQPGYEHPGDPRQPDTPTGTDVSVLALDIGGTKIAAALVDDGTVSHRTQIPTPQTSAEDAWAATPGLITETLAHGPAEGWASPRPARWTWVPGPSAR